MKTLKLYLIGILGILLLTQCDKNNDFVPFFSIEDDKDLGAKVKAEIEANPAEYPMLSESQYPQAYTYIRTLTSKILNDEVTYKDEFVWEVKIIQRDDILNAFCAPGGYIYVYTGLIKYLESEDQLAGVMGHEIAHADQRHSSKAMQTQYGISVLLSVVAGENQGLITEIAANLAALKNSRKHETEADEYSVKYLCPTEYNAAGAAGFFEKLIADGNSGGTPEFLSTHPNPDNRVEFIHDEKNRKGCTGDDTNVSAYEAFKNSLP
jgi:beta-barrel assembly-enhancing protease